VEANLKRFLDLGRTDQPRQEPCALGALVEEVVSLLRPRCRHAHIDLRWQPPPQPIELHADVSQLRHLLLNVLNNALDAAGPGGQVELRMAAGEPDPATCVLEVWDSGPGPPAELESRLFEPFATGKPEGVGLGLAVARQVAEAHGGRIDWRRENGRTCFRLELPRRK